MNNNLDDTIAAIATPLGEGGIGIIRISGNQSVKIASKIIENFPEKIEKRKVYTAWILDGPTRVDKILYFLMQSPQSYTGEDVLEINCHGGITVMRSVLELIIKSGARIAERGEFTKRAFLNGKIDLLQAEAILDLIRAKNRVGAGVAIQQFEGYLSGPIKEMRQKLISLQANLEAEIDFPDDLSETNLHDFSQKLHNEIGSIDCLLATAEMGKIIREGLSTAIIGKPNVGKSSLLNALLREDRAIVTEIPGTTRDFLEETLNIGGLPLRIIDTAGIRHPKDKAEELGVFKAKSWLRQADLVLIVLDAADNLDENDLIILQAAKEKKAIIVLNKVDLGQKINKDLLGNLVNGSPIYKVSALYHQGITDLEEGILRHIGFNRIKTEEGGVLINLRQQNSLLRARQSLQQAIQSAQKNMSTDLIAIDLKEAIVALGEVTGEVVTEEIINHIFAQFCVGK